MEKTAPNPTIMQKELAAIVGKEWVSEGIKGYAVDGVWPKLVVRPGTVEELAAVLRRAHQAGWIVVPAGFGTGLSLGNLIDRIDLVISTTRLNEVLDYEPADLTASVQAGCSLERFNQVVGEHGQWLPLDPPQPERATLGAVAAANDFGPLRSGFGLARDYVIGLEVVRADGTRVKTGGRVVKNVAGYDLNKLFVGSLGTLGIMTQLNFKLRPRPETEATCVISGNDEPTLRDFVQLVATSELSPAAIELLSLTTCLRLSVPWALPSALLMKCMGVEPAVQYQIRRLKEMARAFNEERGPTLHLEVEELADSVAGPLWRSVCDFRADPEFNLILRLSTLSSDIGLALAYLVWVVDIPSSDLHVSANLRNGVAWAQVWVDATDAQSEKLAEGLRKLRNELQQMNGSLIVERAPVALKERIDVWGEVGPTADIMRALKQQFDPRRILNPGRFVAGI